jgi:hypothetical protein
MLPELVILLASRVARPFRGSGYLRDSVALWSRARRRREDWRPHEERCHAVVRRAMADLPRRRTVVVLGSGLVRDVPLPDLLDGFERVVLVDAVHLHPVRKAMADHGKVTLVEADLSGVLGWIDGRASRREDPLAPWRDAGDVDLVISANLASQLPFAVDRRLERARSAPPGCPADLGERLPGLHLADLASLTCRVCLLTDVAMDEIAPDGTIVESTDLFYGATLPPPEESWDWLVAPRGEIHRRNRFVHRVQAFTDFAAARGRHSGNAEPEPSGRVAAARRPE